MTGFQLPWPVVCLPGGGHSVTGSAQWGSGHLDRMPAETRRSFELSFSIWLGHLHR